MTSMNPMLRNTPTVSERIKMNNSGYSLGTVRSLQDQQTMKMRMGAGSLVADNNIFGNLFGKQLNNAQLDLMAARAAGSKSGEQQAIDQGKWLAPMAMRERIVSINPGMEPEQREAILRSPRPEPDTWKARMKSQPSQPDPFSGGYQPKGEGDPYGPLPPRPKGFSMGGTLDGPGGPTDDMIPAVVDGVEPVRLSDGEEIVDAKTRDFFGKKFFLDLKKKAMKGELEGMQMQKPKEGNVPGFAQGGTLVSPSFAKFEALKNAQSQMPELIPMREQQARDIRLAPMGIEDVGGGRKVLQNRYGTGFSLPDAGAASLISDGSMMRNVGTPTAPRLESIPDPVQGPWGTGGAMPDLGQPERRADIAAQIDQLRSEAPRRRAADIAAAQPMRPQQGTPIPPMMMQASRPTAPSQPFMSPSEKDAAARGSRMERDAAQGRPDGMRETDWQRLRKDPRFLMAQASAKAKAIKEGQPVQAVPVLMPDGSVSTSHYSANGTILAKGGRENIPAAKYAPDAAKALMAVKDGGGLDLTELAAIAADNRYDIATRGLAQKHLKRRADQPEQAPGRVVMKGGQPIILNPDGTFEEATDLNAVTDAEKTEAFKAKFGRPPGATDEQDWSQAWYLAREAKKAQRKGGQPTASTPITTGAAPKSFASPAAVQEAAAKGEIKPGDKVMVDGRTATWK